MTNTPRGSVGGAAQRGTPRGPGSSPGLSARQRKALHKKLRRLDKKLAWFDLSRYRWTARLAVLSEKEANRECMRLEKLDAERKRTRLRLKGYKEEEK